MVSDNHRGYCSLFSVLLFLALIITGCDQSGTVAPSPEDYASQQFVNDFKVPAGADVNSDSLEYVSQLYEVTNSAISTEARVRIDFWDQLVHDISWRDDDSLVTYQSSSEKNTFQMVVKDKTGEMTVQINDEELRIPPVEELSDSDLSTPGSFLEPYQHLVDKIVFVIQEVRLQTLHRSADDPRIATLVPTRNSNLEKYSGRKASTEVLQKLGDNSKDISAAAKMFFVYSPYICCNAGYESYGGDYGSSVPMAVNAARISIQAGCSCRSSLGCTSYVGPDWFTVVPYSIYWAEGCGGAGPSCPQCPGLY